jgi:type III restriction enzyme
LRQAQLRALETYWYLRLVEGTPHVFEPYQRYYTRPLDLLAALGLDRDEIKDFVADKSLEIFSRTRTLGDTQELGRLTFKVGN